jgi:hypothetical protein
VANAVRPPATCRRAETAGPRTDLTGVSFAGLGGRSLSSSPRLHLAPAASVPGVTEGSDLRFSICDFRMRGSRGFLPFVNRPSSFADLLPGHRVKRANGLENVRRPVVRLPHAVPGSLDGPVTPSSAPKRGDLRSRRPHGGGLGGLRASLPPAAVTHLWKAAVRSCAGETGFLSYVRDPALQPHPIPILFHRRDAEGAERSRRGTALDRMNRIYRMGLVGLPGPAHLPLRAIPLALGAFSSPVTPFSPPLRERWCRALPDGRATDRR